MKLPHILKPLLKKEKNYQRRLDKTYFFSRAQGKRSEKRSEKSRDMIIRLLQENPSLSANALAEKIGITPRVVERHISKLKAEGVLFRDGADHGGKWVVVEQGKSEK